MASSVVITHKEASFFLLSIGGAVYLLVCGVWYSYYTLACLFVLFACFVTKRKEVYFLWSAIAPRITGTAPILNNLLILAREEALNTGVVARRGKEGSGNGEDMNDLLRFDIPFMKPIFFIFKPSYVKKVLSLEPDNFPTKGYAGVLVKLTHTPDNVLLNGGPPSPHWTHYRELTAEMNKGCLEGEVSIDAPPTALAVMFDEGWKACQELTHIFDAKRGSSQSLDLFFELFKYMLPAHNRALFGEEFAQKHTYDLLAEEMYHVVTEAGTQLSCPYTLPSREQTFLARVKRISNAVINMAKESTTPFSLPWQEALKKGQLTEEEFRSNLLTFEYAQAPLHAVFWVVYMLSLHPEVERNVVSEITQVLSQGPIEYSRLHEFRYLEKVLAETLRLFPGVGLLQARYPTSDCMLGKHLIPAGSPIFVSPFLIQRNARFWPNPDEFNPNRDGIDNSTPGSDNLTYIPFGYGPRHCPGQYFARDFIKAALVSLLQHHKIHLIEGQKVAVPTEIGFLRAEKPVYFYFSARVLPKIPGTASPCLAVNFKFGADAEEEEEEEPQLRVTSRRPSITRVLMSPKTGRMSKLVRSPSSSPRMTRRSSLSNKFVNKNDILILWGSQSGRSRTIAKRLTKMGVLHGLDCVCLSMADCDISTIPQFTTVLVITSTYGDGGPPENAEQMSSWLAETHPSDLWWGVNYAVMALGSSMYSHPFKFGEFVSTRFSQLGANQLIEDEKIDEMRCFDEDSYKIFSHNWSLRLFQIITNRKQNKYEKEVILRSQNLHAPFDLSFEDDVLDVEPRKNYPDNVVVATVTSNEVVNNDPSNKIYCVKLNFLQNPIDFQPGDNIAVMPANDINIVERLVTRLGFSKNRVFTVTENTVGGAEACADFYCSRGKNKCTLEIALSYFYDITSSPSKSMLDFFAANCNDPETQKLLEYSSSNYHAFLLLEYTLLDVLELFPAIQLQCGEAKKSNNKGKERGRKIKGKNEELLLGEFLGLLKPLRTRVYSVASSIEERPTGSVELVYKVVEYSTKSGREKRGVCSSWLQSRKPGDEVGIFLVKAKFRLPIALSTPIIMVGAGTGISPYFSFLEHRAHTVRNIETDGAEQTTLGRVLLIHGCRSESDIPHQNKIAKYLEEGVLSDMWPAYSRKEGVKPTYVQHIMENEGATLWNLLENESAILYTSGDEKIKVAVRDACVKFAQDFGKLDTVQSTAWLQNLISTGRFH